MPADDAPPRDELTDAELEAITAGKDSLGTPMTSRRPPRPRDSR